VEGRRRIAPTTSGCSIAGGRCRILEQEVIDRRPGIRWRLDWFLKNRRDLADQIACMGSGPHDMAARKPA
jgi:hypothetical protein